MSDGSLRTSKVPAITLGFWIIKILCTTLGETGGDPVSMSWLGETTPCCRSGQPGRRDPPRETAPPGVPC